MLRRTVAVAMSGGVDSSVAALLLKEAGYDVHGIFMRTWNAEDDSDPIGECPWKVDLEDARAVCERLGATFEVVNMIANYRRLVVDDLVDGYSRGITPNPDALCNARVKFGVLKKYAHGRGFAKFATGHHCRMRTNGDGSHDILEGADGNKDQSYFLALLSQDQTANTLFPIGNLLKADVRSIAREAGLPNGDKADSQGICFLGRVKIQKFLSKHIPDSPGDIVAADGRVLGRHDGLFRFTIGQRHGLNLPSNVDFAHYVVVGKDMRSNRLIVEIECADSKLLYDRDFSVHGLSFTNAPIRSRARLLARPRYRDPAQAVEFFPMENGRARVIFDGPQRAIASGQVIALYDGETLLGGGVFS